MTTRSSNQSFDKIIEALRTLENASEFNPDEVKNLLDQQFSKLKDTLKDTLGSASESAKETINQVDSKVKDNPWAYIGGAAAIGLVLGLLLGRRD